MSYLRNFRGTANGIWRCSGLHGSHNDVVCRTKLIIAQRHIATSQYCSPHPGILSKNGHSAGEMSMKNTFLKAAPLLHVCSQRHYMKNKKIKTPPTKPLHFDYSGDLVKELEPLDLSEPKPGFEDVELLKSDNEQLKQMFSLEFSDGGQILKKQLERILAKVQEHPADVMSLEVQIARHTVYIRNLMKHCLQFRKDKRNKVVLIERIYGRQRLLRKLQAMDIEKFDWLCDELKLKYTPVPEHNRNLSRRAARKAAAREKCWAIKAEKMEAFKKQLEQQREVFEEFKAKELDEIEGMLKNLGITEMKSVEQVAKDLGLGEPYVKKKEKYKTRRQRLLEMKFELYKHLPKYQPPTP